MITNTITFINGILEGITSMLTTEPISYIFGLGIFAVVIKIIKTLR